MHVYAEPWSRIYHDVTRHDAATQDLARCPTLKCDGTKAIHDLMSTRLAEGLGYERDQYGDRLCRRCFPHLKTKERTPMTVTHANIPPRLPSLGDELAKPLRDWLISDRINARCLWQVPATKRDPRAIEGWLVNGHVVIVVIASYGWEIYTQPKTNKIDETLAEIEAACGIPAASTKEGTR